MAHTLCFRRRLRKKFVMLAAGALLLCMLTAGCVGDHTALPTVIGIYFTDANMQHVDLRGNQAVPVHTQFTFVFSRDMEKARPAPAITFKDSQNNAVGFTISWADARTLIITPDADLALSTEYIITIHGAEDTNTNPLNPYADQSADFRTASI